MGLLTEIDRILKQGYGFASITKMGEAPKRVSIANADELRDKILSKITEAVDGAELKPDEIEAALINEASRLEYPFISNFSDEERDEIVANAQLQAIKKAIKGEK